MDYLDACSKLNETPEPDLARVHARFPVLITPYYLSLIDRGLGQDDPIRQECMPSLQELEDSHSSFDPLAEKLQSVTPRLIRRFGDRVVLLVTGRCAMHCRFCFRKRFWADGASLADISDGEIAEAMEYLSDHPEIREVLVSGGDPLVLDIDRIKKILDSIAAVKSIEVIRIGSRIPVVDPDKISSELAQLIADYDGTWLLTHFNSIQEVTPQSIEACQKFIQRGVPVLNQTVLLKGVNDSPRALEKLFRVLVKNRIKPHYLFHVDPVLGVRHFATGINVGLDILRAFRGTLSSLAVPTFAIDLPAGGGKVALQPNYEEEGKFRDITNARLIEYPDR